MEIPFSHVLGNVWTSALNEKIKKTLDFEMLVFSQNFHLLYEFTFPIFWRLMYVWINASHEI